MFCVFATEKTKLPTLGKSKVVVAAKGSGLRSPKSRAVPAWVKALVLKKVFRVLLGDLGRVVIEVGCVAILAWEGGDLLI